jgi:hypothetical protein
MNPQFPIYVISKGRAESRLTSKAFEAMGVPYRIVIEQQEFDQYAAVIDESKIIVLDESYKQKFDTCDDLDDTKTKGSGPARNFVWDHAVAEGHAWHWIVDDNIKEFWRLNNNLKIKVSDGTIFRCMEDFCLRYENVALAGPNYHFFAKRKQLIPPFVANTRVYSCILIRNDIPYRWRCRYNEDVDLSLRVLKGGWCTVQFNAFLQGKAQTQSMRGGNTDELYKDGTLEKSQMIARLHPDCARVLWRFGRPHHYVNYRAFQKKNKMMKRKGVLVSDAPDEYGMRLVHNG